MAGLMEFETGPFTEADRAALAWARALTVDASGTSDELFARVRAHWSEAEVVEITAMAGLFNYFNRVAEALRIEPTEPGEGL